MFFDSAKSNLRPIGMAFWGLTSRFTLLVGLMLALVTTPAFSQSASEINDRGNKAYARRAYDDAVAHYGAAISRNPFEAAPFHNRGLAEIKLLGRPCVCKGALIRQRESSAFRIPGRRRLDAYFMRMVSV